MYICKECAKAKSQNSKCAFRFDKRFNQENYNCETMNKLVKFAVTHNLYLKSNNENIGIIPWHGMFIIIEWGGSTLEIHHLSILNKPINRSVISILEEVIPNL